MKTRGYYFQRNRHQRAQDDRAAVFFDRARGATTAADLEDLLQEALAEQAERRISAGHVHKLRELVRQRGLSITR